jgi:hypothetical protein
MDQKDLEQIRLLAQTMLERLKTDPVFKEQVQTDPQVLIAAGLPEIALPDFLASTDLLDVAGYMGCSSISAL